MKSILFIHGFATGPAIWKDQIREFARDFHATTDLSHIDRTEEVFLVGWSMGGWKALDLWQEHHQKIKRLVLVSAFPKYVKNDDYPCGTPEALIRKMEKKFLTDYKSGMRYFYELVFKDKKYHRLIDHLPAPEKPEVIKWFDRLKNDDKRDLLPKINVPVLIIHGDKDPIVSPTTAKYMQVRIKNSELHLFSGVGHVPFLEETEKFNLCLRNFLANNAN